MGKYLNFVRLSFGSLLEYRLDFIVQFLSGVVGSVVLMFFWVSLAQSGVDIRPYTISSLVYYYFFMATVTSLIDFSSDMICWEIREGHVANVVIKPVSYLLTKWFSSFAEKFVALVAGVVFVVVLLSFGFRLSTFSFGSLIVFLVALAVASVANFLIEFNIGLLGFWMSYTGGIRSAVNIASLLVSGRMVPMELLPGFINNLSMFLPFRYIYFFPVEVLMGQIGMGKMIIGLVILGGWVFILLAMTAAIWRVGIRRLEVVGT